MLNSITKAHATREQKMPGVVSRNRAVYRFRGPFFVPFLGKQKRKLQNRSKNKADTCIFIPATRATI